MIAQRNWGGRRRWNHMYCFSPCTSPSIRTCDQLDGETLAAKCQLPKVTPINRNRDYRIEYFDGWWTSFGHPHEARRSRNHNSKWAEQNHILHPGSSILTEMTDKTFQTSSRGHCNFRISPRHVESLPDVRMCLSFFLWNPISDRELRRPHKAFRDDFVLPLAMTLGNISLRHYALTVDAITKQYRSRYKVSSAMTQWTSTNKLAITSVLACDMDWKCALREVQLDFDKADHLFPSPVES